MRVFEWLFLFSFTPFLVIRFVPSRWQPGWVIVSALLPTLACGIHLVVEGWRIQMFPLYIFAVIVLLIRLWGLLHRKPSQRLGHGLIANGLIIIFLVLNGILAGWLLPIVELPAPTGPYEVGIVDHALLDEERGRRLMVSIWYPAAKGGTPAPLTHYPDEVAAGLGNLAGFPGLPFQYLRYFKLSANEGAPLVAEGSPFPILVFSHGLVGLRLQNSSTMQELASRGYIVIAIDHTDAAAVTVFPDNEVRFYDLKRFRTPADLEPSKDFVNDRVFPAWVADQRFIYDSLEKWAADDPVFGGRLDLTRIGSFGHSFGGATALEVCRIDMRCRAAVNMDGGLYGGIRNEPAVRPVLLMTSGDSSRNTEAVEKWTRMITNAHAPAFWLEIPNSTHFSFTITQLLSPLLVPRNFDPRAGLHTIDSYLLAFFDHHLRGIETAPSDQASEKTDVHWFTEARLSPFRK
jgi:predicted dienelactone hydrolase